MKLFLTLLILFMQQQNSFKQNQLKHARVHTAYNDKEQTLKNLFKEKNLKYEGFTLFIRGFKKEKKLEIWVKESGKENYSLLTEYDFCATSGTLGPKRREGDGQIPEGIYSINHFNPLSNFHLSLGINYPNKSDRVFADKVHPGSAIYIHGNCVTIGCIPITDDKIKELYILGVEAKNNGQDEIPVHIFPTKLTEPNLQLIKKTTPESETQALWTNLKDIYTDFESEHKLRKVAINGKGKYYTLSSYF